MVERQVPSVTIDRRGAPIKSYIVTEYLNVRSDHQQWGIKSKDSLTQGVDALREVAVFISRQAL